MVYKTVSELNLLYFLFLQTTKFIPSPPSDVEIIAVWTICVTLVIMCF